MSGGSLSLSLVCLGRETKGGEWGEEGEKEEQEEDEGGGRSVEDKMKGTGVKINGPEERGWNTSVRREWSLECSTLDT